MRLDPLNPHLGRCDLEIAGACRIESVSRRLDQFSTSFERRHPLDRPAIEIREAIAAYLDANPAPALAEG
jgi:hypothetical protein